MQQANETMERMESLGKSLESHFSLEFKPGPMKGEDRIKEKRDNDYGGDVRRVIDFVRCSFILASESLEQAKQIVDGFRSPDGQFSKEWKLIRVKDGFEKADNFTVGGYRDIKLNVMNTETGHIIEIQLHLKAYLELKEGGGHAHYEFSRTLNVVGVTNAVQILELDQMIDAYSFGSKSMVLDYELKSYQETTKILRRLGDIEAAWELHHLAASSYIRAVDLVEDMLPKDEVDDPKIIAEINVELCRVLTGFGRAIASLRLLSDYEIESTNRWYQERWETEIQTAYIDRVIKLAADCFGETHPRCLRAKNLTALVIASEAHQAKDYLEAIAKGEVTPPTTSPSIDSWIDDQLDGFGNKQSGFKFVLKKLKQYASKHDAPKDASKHVSFFVEYYNSVVQETERLYEENMNRQMEILGHDHPEVVDMQCDLATFFAFHYHPDNNENITKSTKKDDDLFAKAFDTYKQSIELSVARMGWLSSSTEKIFQKYFALLDDPFNKKIVKEKNLIKILKEMVMDEKWAVWGKYHVSFGKFFPEELVAKNADELKRTLDLHGLASKPMLNMMHLRGEIFRSLYSHGIKNNDDIVVLVEEYVEYFEGIMDSFDYQNLVQQEVEQMKKNPSPQMALRDQLLEILMEHPKVVKTRPKLKDRIHAVMWHDHWSVHDPVPVHLDVVDGLEGKPYNLKQRRRQCCCCQPLWRGIDKKQLPGTKFDREVTENCLECCFWPCCGSFSPSDPIRTKLPDSFKRSYIAM